VSLQGRHALVTGAGRGIGLAIAVALAKQGARLTLVARDARGLEQASAACRAAGSPQAEGVRRDLTDRAQLDALGRGAAAECDVLVNNAGVAPSASLEKTDDVQWDSTFALNVFAPFALCRAALPGMASRGFGRVVNVGSTAGLRGFAYTTAYTASKHALLGLTRALDAELRQRAPGRDVTVNAVCPGFVDTDIVRDSARRIAAATGVSEEQARGKLGSMNPSGRLLSPEEVAEAVLALVLESPGRTRGAAVELGGAGS
jgi:NAD(P)-dependent dehydrogenase (short-subunit alcohol dehydrogenase family)